MSAVGAAITAGDERFGGYAENLAWLRALEVLQASRGRGFRLNLKLWGATAGELQRASCWVQCLALLLGGSIGGSMVDAPEKLALGFGGGLSELDATAISSVVSACGLKLRSRPVMPLLAQLRAGLLRETMLQLPASLAYRDGVDS